MDLDDKSFMCIADATATNAKGALCDEADIGPTEANKTYKVKTYSIPAASVDTKLQEWTALTAFSSGTTTDHPIPATAALRNFDFDHALETTNTAAGNPNTAFKTMPKIDSLKVGPPATGAAADVKS